MGTCLKDAPLLQGILHVEGLDENTAERLHKTMKGDAAGVTFETLVIFMATVLKVSCRRPRMTSLHRSALSCRKRGGRLRSLFLSWVSCIYANGHGACDLQGPSEMAARLTYELLVAAKSPEDQEEVLEQNLHTLIAWVTGSEQGGDLAKALAQGEEPSCSGLSYKAVVAFTLRNVQCVMHAQASSCMLFKVFSIAFVWDTGAMRSTEGRGFRGPAEFM